MGPGGVCCEFSFQQLAEHGGLGEGVLPFCSRLLGPSWSRWFPTEPSPTRVVPRQAALLLHMALDRVRVAWEDQAAIASRAVDAYAALSTESRRRSAARASAGPY